METHEHGHRDFLERIAEQVGSRSGAHVVFAPPIERDGVTVVPVARVRYGFGGGRGGRGEETGQGGGGGSSATPVGFIELRDGTAEFRAFPDPVAESARTMALLGGMGLGLWFVLRGIRGVLRR